MQGRLVILAVLLGSLHAYASDPEPRELLGFVGTATRQQVVDALAAGASPNLPNAYGFTPLMEAAAAGNTQAVVELIKAGADVNAVDDNGWTAVMYAQKSGISDLVRILVFNGAALPPPEPPAPTYGSLAEAARDGTHSDVLDFLEAGADVNARDESGQTALMYAAGADNAETTEALLRAGAEVDATSVAGWTALMYAARDARTGETLELLIARSADLDHRNDQGQTALDLANPTARGILEPIIAAREAAEAEQQAEAERQRVRALALLQEQFSELVGESAEQQAEAERQQATQEARAANEAVRERARQYASWVGEELDDLEVMTDVNLAIVQGPRIELRSDPSPFIAAWFSGVPAHRIYLIDAEAGTHCRWEVVPSAWAWAHGQLGLEYVRMPSGVTAEIVVPDYMQRLTAIMTMYDDGRCGSRRVVN